MIICRLVPVVRAVRRVVAPRPRPAVVAAAAGVVRRAPRPFLLVCRDAGLGGLLLATTAAAPLPGPAAPAAPPEPSQASAVAADWAGPWGGFPMPAGPLTGTGDPGPGSPGPGPSGDLPPPGPPPPPAGSPVPEPSSQALFALGLAAAALLRRRLGARTAG